MVTWRSELPPAEAIREGFGEKVVLSRNVGQAGFKYLEVGKWRYGRLWRPHWKRCVYVGKLMCARGAEVV